MAEPNLLEQSVVTLTQILTQQHQPTTVRSRIEKDLRLLPNFEGKPGTLPAFVTSAEKAIKDYEEEHKESAFNVLYNEKITGAAKNYLATSPPATWDECKQKLKLHYRASKDQGQIAQQIYSLKVSSIIELVESIRLLVNDVAEFAMFSENQIEVTDQLCSLLVLKIKELTAGALVAELYNQYRLEPIREILNKYIGQDYYNLKFNRNNNSNINRSNRQVKIIITEMVQKLMKILDPIKIETIQIIILITDKLKLFK